MIDLIDRQQAINACRYGNGESEIREILSVMRWIPVSERYPNEEDEYKHFYVTDDKGEISIQKFLISLDKEHRPYFSGMVNVVAWMPLPEPYKAESGE